MWGFARRRTYVANNIFFFLDSTTLLLDSYLSNDLNFSPTETLQSFAM
jgi:hypothetical protein